jgi:hypothetical protein
LFSLTVVVTSEPLPCVKAGTEYVFPLNEYALSAEQLFTVHFAHVKNQYHVSPDNVPSLQDTAPI